MALSRRKKIIIAVSAVALLGLIVVFSIFASKKDEPEVQTVKVKVRPELSSTVIASGEVRPVNFINLTSEVAGRIEEIYVKEGDKVTVGQPLVRLDPTQLESSKDAQLAAVQGALNDVQSSRTQEVAAQNGVTQAQQGLIATEASLATARQQVVVAQTDVDRAQVEVNTAQRELKRTTDLLEAGVSSRSEYDAARDRVETARVSLRTSQERLQQQKIAVQEAVARINQQKVAVRESQIGVERARASTRASESRVDQQQAVLRGQSSQRSKALQTSPMNGVVMDIPSKVGTFAIANLSSTALMTIGDMSTINIEVKVDETEVDKVAVGQSAKIKIDAFQNQEINGSVSQIKPLAQGKSQTSGGLSNTINVQEAKEFLIVVRLDNLPEEMHDSLRPGMSATATITTKTSKDVIAVPLQAVVEKQPDTAANINGSVPAPGGKPKPVKGVYYLENGRVKFREVETGITGETDIEILQGVDDGMEIITGPSRIVRTLKEGQTVKRQAAGANNNKSS